MKFITLLGTTVLFALISTTALASSAYFGTNISTDTNECKSLTGTLGYKYFHGIGPQVRLIGTDGDLCKSKGSKLGFDIRKDTKLGRYLIGNIFAGVETTTSLKEPDLVLGAGVGYPIAKKFLVEATINTTKDNEGDNDIMYGMGINYIF